ncbi:hypothetical protein BO79DRAFT_288144 [Aspergillus costaricaensis CBS 115574]|uniref:Uncharacterized protein n=1 Tax=Aspergillus costaricaensis CBS 115574 TaxID=1448317 RepID=A0ACD1IC76_9EURO|nr:hypothetical protein BO79DRAFT_288144 [Aspergillus costaricaensis CBS 115574]RAK87830.1 hypothetical protein BO79DRAFT_288144 [Aspergillus costaricaensis CBS 115574]
MFQLRKFAVIGWLAFVVNCGSFGIQGSLDFHGALIDSVKEETPSATTVTVMNRMSESTSAPIQTSTTSSERICTKSIAMLTLFTPSSAVHLPCSVRSTPISNGQPHQESAFKSIKTPYFQQNKTTYSRSRIEDARLIQVSFEVWVTPLVIDCAYDIVREVIPLPLEDHIRPQESTQVDLAVEPSGVSRVRHVCELVECQRWDDDDPLIWMQQDNDARGKRIRACTHALQQYIKARRSAVTDDCCKMDVVTFQ